MAFRLCRKISLTSPTQFRKIPVTSPVSFRIPHSPVSPKIQPFSPFRSPSPPFSGPFRSPSPPFSGPRASSGSSISPNPQDSSGSSTPPKPQHSFASSIPPNPQPFRCFKLPNSICKQMPQLWHSFWKHLLNLCQSFITAMKLVDNIFDPFFYIIGRIVRLAGFIGCCLIVYVSFGKIKENGVKIYVADIVAVTRASLEIQPGLKEFREVVKLMKVEFGKLASQSDAAKEDLGRLFREIEAIKWCVVSEKVLRKPILVLPKHLADHED